MTEIGKILVVMGLVLAGAGGVVYLLGKMGFRGLPGDVSYESSNVKVYFPIVSCLVLSAVLTGGMWLWRWWSGR
ncbi:MAG TPA: DUF2905 domain-containing protein [Tepidisphaeraceae bacterium]|nr:DUF2905 domain-containing protein [Tepidisphaeraceae bacterium]